MISTGKPLISSFSPPSIFDPEKIVDLHKWKKRTMPEILRKVKKELTGRAYPQTQDSKAVIPLNILCEIFCTKLLPPKRNWFSGGEKQFRVK